MKTKVKKVTITIILLVCVLVVADYCELFMALHKSVGGRIPFTFKLQDQNTSKPLAGLTVKLSYYDNELQCKATPKGNIDGCIFASGNYTSTLFFNKPNFYKEVGNRKVEFLFFHPSYEIISHTYFIKI